MSFVVFSPGVQVFLNLKGDRWFEHIFTRPILKWNAKYIFCPHCSLSAWLIFVDYNESLYYPYHMLHIIYIILSYYSTINLCYSFKPLSRVNVYSVRVVENIFLSKFHVSHPNLYSLSRVYIRHRLSYNKMYGQMQWTNLLWSVVNIYLG